MTPADFLRGIVALPKRAGREVLRLAFVLLILLKDPNTPAWAKAAIVVVFAYLLNPFDAIPDVLPFGFTDDLSALAAVVASLGSLVTPSVEAEADRRLLTL